MSVQSCPTYQIMPRLKAKLTPHLKGQRWHTLGDKWGTCPIVQKVPLSIYWLPKGSITRWFTRSAGQHPSRRFWGRRLSLRLLHSEHICANGASIWFIREWTEAGPHQPRVFVQSQHEFRKRPWMQGVTTGVRDKRRKMNSCKPALETSQGWAKRRFKQNFTTRKTLKIRNASVLHSVAVKAACLPNKLVLLLFPNGLSPFCSFPSLIPQAFPAHCDQLLHSGSSHETKP